VSVDLGGVLGSSNPGTEVPTSNKGVCTLENHGPAGDRPCELARPSQNTLPNLGRKCGRRERESRSEGRRESSLRVVILRVRGGERHPGFLEGATLRGVSLEKRPRSVRRSGSGIPPKQRRTDDSGCPEVAEEGNAVSMRRQAYASGTRTSLRVIRGRVLRSVLRPVHVNPHYTPAHASVVGRRAGITVGQTRASGRNLHWGRYGRTLRGSPLVTALRKGSSVVSSEKEGDRGLRPCEDLELGSGCSHVVVVAEVGRRRPVSNKLGKRAPKRAAGSSERGPSSVRKSAGETA